MLFFKDGNFVPPKLAEYILTKNHYLSEQGRLYQYSGGVYVEIKEDHLKKECLDLLGEEYRDRHGSEIVRYIMTKLSARTLQIKMNTDLINVKNGLLDWRTGILHPHSSEHKTLVQLPLVYNPSAKCPQIEKFFSEVLHGDCLELVYEIFGYFMIPYSKAQKAFLLKSGGDSGKSVFLDLLQSFLGACNTASETLQALTKDKFRAINLHGKLANIFADLSEEMIDNSGVFKTLVSGDEMTGEEKHRQSIKFRNTARMIFSANAIPRSRDNTHGYFKRWTILDFPNKFVTGDSRRDNNLLDKLTTEEELSGLLNMAILGLNRFMTNQKFTKALSSDAELLKYQILNDSARAFFEEHMIMATDGRLKRNNIYQSYKWYCDENQKKPFGLNKFYEKLRNQFPLMRDLRSGGVDYFVGVALKNNGDDILEGGMI